MKLSEELQYRGFANQSTFANLADLDSKPITLYLGTDPSGDSLHVGHLAVYMMVRRFLDHGKKVILLVGGGTGMIGDMRDTEERELLSLDTIAHNKKALSAQVSRLFSGQDFTLVDNYDWLHELNLLDFLRETGKKFNMAELVQRDFFKSRIQNGGGLSFAEFTYTLLQGYDFNHLHKNYGVNLQIGGSDQWGNILSGVELIRKNGGEAFGMTSPLVINKSTGRKFGKSEGGAVWLDPKKTSPFKFYQFWLNTDDESAIDYLKLFTLLKPDQIDEITKIHSENPGQRLAQKTLSREITNLVHSEDISKNVEKVSEILFGKNADFSNISEEEFNIFAEELPTINFRENLTIIDALTESKIVKSRSEANRLIAGNAVSINGEKVQTDQEISKKSLIKKGKNQFVFVK